MYLWGTEWRNSAAIEFTQKAKRHDTGRVSLCRRHVGQSPTQASLCCIKKTKSVDLVLFLGAASETWTHTVVPYAPQTYASAYSAMAAHSVTIIWHWIFNVKKFTSNCQLFSLRIYYIMLNEGLDLNMLAISVANILAEGKSKQEILELQHFLSLLQWALKSYIFWFLSCKNMGFIL